MRALILSLLLALVLLPRPAATAETFEVDTGLWRFVTKTDGGPSAGKTRTGEECIQDGKWSPERFMRGGMEGCKLIDVVSTRTAMRWKMLCETTAGPMYGSAEMTTAGSVLSGSISINASVAGRKLTMRTIWSGSRIGECP